VGGGSSLRAIAPDCEDPGAATGRLAARAAGLPPPAVQAHHIVAKHDSLAAEARVLLERCGIDVHDARNGVMLPEHAGRHRRAYHQFVADALEATLAGNGDCAVTLEQLANKLLSGELTVRGGG
jgi:hypothetical protein